MVMNMKPYKTLFLKTIQGRRRRPKNNYFTCTITSYILSLELLIQCVYIIIIWIINAQLGSYYRIEQTVTWHTINGMCRPIPGHHQVCWEHMQWCLHQCTKCMCNPMVTMLCTSYSIYTFIYIIIIALYVFVAWWSHTSKTGSVQHQGQCTLWCALTF